jgi:acetate kinase
MAQGNARARLAFDTYVHSLRCHIGAMLASLGGLDRLRMLETSHERRKENRGHGR